MAPVRVLTCTDGGAVPGFGQVASMVFSTGTFTVIADVDGRLDRAETPRIANAVAPDEDWSRMGELEIPAGD